MLERRSRPSTLSRLSIFLPNFMHPDSKPEQDIQKKPLPADRTPSIPDHIRNHEPPSRAPPPTPQKDPLPPISTSNRLHKAQSPTRRLVSTPITPSSHPVIENSKLRKGTLGPPTPQQTPLEPTHSRSFSSPINTHPSFRPGSSDGEQRRISKTKSWLGGGGRKSRNASQDDLSGTCAQAWVNAGSHKIDYTLALLVNGDKVPELWDESADTLVYLFPESTGRGPSFKVPSMVLSSSLVLMNYIDPKTRARGQSFTGRDSLSVEDATRNLALRGVPPLQGSTADSQSSQSISDGQVESLRSFQGGPRDIHIRFPTGLTTDGSDLSPHDTQILVDIRNLFAFLTGQPLVGTRFIPTTFQIFIALGEMLKRFEFTNIDGSTFGEAATASFDFFVDDLRLEDVRNSREKTIEGIILGESMRCANLYKESFTHAVGKYSAVKDKSLPLFDSISPATRALLERASLDLGGRQSTANQLLVDFEFPSLFAGFAASTTSEESKFVRFKNWKANFLSMRKFVLSYYKDLHGSWPPKASSKKNAFVVGGLNRLVLKGLYADLCSLYDLKADRSEVTTRTSDGDEEEAKSGGLTNAALRVLLGEFDRSSPPVKPPIPFDVPLVPSITTVDPRSHQLSAKERHKLSTRRLKEYETTLIVAKTHNIDSHHNTPFLEAYKKFEAKEAKGKNSLDLVDQAYGHWIFLYAVIQSLPPLAVDALGLRYSEGVEYFLCMPPSASMPWVDDAPKTTWYSVQGGQRTVALPTDLVENGNEAVYRRSHCWTAAEQWLGNANEETQEFSLAPQLSPLAPPPGFGEEFGFRPPSRGRQDQSLGLALDQSPNGGTRSVSRQNKRQSIALGLERLPIPSGQWSPISPGSRGTSPASIGHQRDMSMTYSRPRTPASGVANTGATFDQILGTSNVDDGKKGKGKKI
ncbi:hypothetical protein BJ875DRAFT_387185 [Amylocarpus encephaloides]|uniref:DUF8004 domain-containing protein n=1 Tax=Amylocarpus encephaloides TaxID=45428 RepID=A0A9P7YA28_9HELO|nr:hypothetical protein BJ875DRAFT_387185 [Amylocarpus encephaloides]